MINNVLEIWLFEFRICFACLREAASAKAGISIFEFRISASLLLVFLNLAAYGL
jgi:hypothetical protein